MENKGEVVIYETADGQASIEVRLEDETVWLNQPQMAELFQKAGKISACILITYSKRRS